MQNVGLDESQTEIKISRRNINLRYIDDSTLKAESKEELKSLQIWMKEQREKVGLKLSIQKAKIVASSLIMRVKEETEKTGLKLNIQKTKIMASGPIASWQVDRETMETVRDFFFVCVCVCAPKSLQMVAAAMKLKDACCLERKL